MTNPVWVSMAPINSSRNVGTDRTGSALVKKVIHSNRVPGILPYPLLPKAASRREKFFTSAGSGNLSQAGGMKLQTPVKTMSLQTIETFQLAGSRFLRLSVLPHTSYQPEPGSWMNALTIRTWASRWNRFQALPAYRKRLIVQTALLVLISWASLRLFSLQRILHRLQVLAQQPPRRTPYTMADIQHAVAAVGRALPLEVNTASGLAPRSLRIPLPPSSVPAVKLSMKEKIRSCNRFASCCCQ